MKLTRDAKIRTPNGETIGNLNRFVIDPRNKQVTHIVFEHGLLAKEEYVIPFDWIDRVDEQGIHLRFLPVNNPNELTRFREEDYLVTDEYALLDKESVSSDNVSSYYYYPTIPFGMSGMLRPNEMYVDQPPNHPTGLAQPDLPARGEDTPVIKRTEENIPDQTVALKEGAKVLSSDHKHIGNVEQVILDKENKQATHLLVTKGLLLQERKLVPADWVDNMLEDEVYLGVDENFIQRLPDFRERE